MKRSIWGIGILLALLILSIAIAAGMQKVHCQISDLYPRLQRQRSKTIGSRRACLPGRLRNSGGGTIALLPPLPITPPWMNSMDYSPR